MLKEKLGSLNAKLEQIRNEKLKPKNSQIKTDDIVRGSIIKLIVDLSSQKERDVFKLTRQQFKEKYLKAFIEEIVYVDLEKNSTHIYLRCKSADTAKSLLGKSDFLDQFKKEPLNHEEEMEYNRKIYQNRNKKLEKKDKKLNKSKVLNLFFYFNGRISKDLKLIEFLMFCIYIIRMAKLQLKN